MGLQDLIVDGGVGDRGLVENGVELQVLELRLPVHARDILGDEIAAEAREVLEVAGAEIVYDHDAGVGMAALEFERQVGADEASPAGDQDVLHGAESSGGNGRWQMADGRWQMANGRWQMAE